ncbi:MAG: hypothetical protein PVF70_03850 [Anaerolineales bacterium]
MQRTSEVRRTCFACSRGVYFTCDIMVIPRPAFASLGMTPFNCHSEAFFAEESLKRDGGRATAAAAYVARATSWGFLSRRGTPPSE